MSLDTQGKVKNLMLGRSKQLLKKALRLEEESRRYSERAGVLENVIEILEKEELLGEMANLFQEYADPIGHLELPENSEDTPFVTDTLMSFVPALVELNGPCTQEEVIMAVANAGKWRPFSVAAAVTKLAKQKILFVERENDQIRLWEKTDQLASETVTAPKASQPKKDQITTASLISTEVAPKKKKKGTVNDFVLAQFEGDEPKSVAEVRKQVSLETEWQDGSVYSSLHRLEKRKKIERVSDGLYRRI